MYKCNTCEYGCYCSAHGKEKEKYFCGKFQGFISMPRYKELKFCRFYETKKEKGFI